MRTMDSALVPVPVAGTGLTRHTISKTGPCSACNSATLSNGAITFCAQHAQRQPGRLNTSAAVLTRPGVAGRRARASSEVLSDQLGLLDINSIKAPSSPNDVRGAQQVVRGRSISPAADAVTAGAQKGVSSPVSPSPSIASSSPRSPSFQGPSPPFSSSPTEYRATPWSNGSTRSAWGPTSPIRATPPPLVEPKPTPYRDITRLRVDNSGRGSLHPGSIFKGTQMSGDNSYDVTITIVNVDFASSSLCGYLNIQNLTPELPDITTYFSAELIGTQYGFLAHDSWGSSESEDLAFWSKFPGFRALKQAGLKRPSLTIPTVVGAGTNAGVITAEKKKHGGASAASGMTFMRLKEHFLVPDHKRKELDGASFAGFYYVALSETFEDGRSVAAMTGYYHHANLEGDQQLSVRHVRPVKKTYSSFELA